MIKRIFLLLAIVMGCAAAQAQHNPGSWKVFPMAGEYFDQILDTPSKVFYLTGGSLYSYDKQADETIYYAPGERISDSGISKLYYNETAKYVMVVYSNSNVDLIYENGNLVNLPEIKDANITTGKKIRDVSFRNNCAYLATEFGFVIYDDTNHVVKESAMIGTSFPTLLANKDYLFTIIQQGSEYKFACSPIAERHNSISKFTPLCGAYIKQVIQVDENNFLFISGDGAAAKVYRLIASAPESATFVSVVAVPNYKSFFKHRDGFMVQCDNGLVMINSKGEYTSTVPLTTALKALNLATYEGLNRVWGYDKNGLMSVKLTPEGTVTVLSEASRPDASRQLAAGYSLPSPDGKSVYITRIGMSEFHPGGDPNWSMHMPYICEKYDWENSTFTAVYPYGYTNKSGESRAEQNKYKTGYFMGGPANTLVDLEDPSVIYHANQFEGLVVVKDRVILRELAASCFPISFSWGARVECIEFDQMGNLWIGAWTNGNTRPYCYLPKEKVAVLRTNPNAIVKADFVSASAWPAADPGKIDMKIMAVPGTTKMFAINGSWGGHTVGYDHKGTVSASDDVAVDYKGYLDQDGNINQPQRKCCLLADHNGKIWIGTSSGVFVIDDIDQIGVKGASGENLNVIRPKVPRNDGTPYADYLLASETVLWMAVDPSNRKWVATLKSGVYLVSEDGTQIISHFTKDNTPLVSNTVYTVSCDPNGNDVLLGTPEGMFLYSSTAAPASDSYDNVYAYPNPVRPDYTGWITVSGLMNNSLVKIADMQGNVLAEGLSEGGMFVWDGCNRDGSRVKAGVYLVLASEKNSTDPAGVVTKVVVIN